MVKSNVLFIPNNSHIQCFAYRKFTTLSLVDDGLLLTSRKYAYC